MPHVCPSAGLPSTGVCTETFPIRLNADKGKLKYLRWENAGCVGCNAKRCLTTGTVYEGQPTYGCAVKATTDCGCDGALNKGNCTNGPKDPFAYALAENGTAEL
jgi:hypothetical protein